MSKFFALLALVVVVNSPLASASDMVLSEATLRTIIVAAANPFNLINWKVGDTASYNVTVASFPINGTMVKSVTKDDGATLWLDEDINLQIQDQKAEVQINKADGKILKMTVNGQDQAIPTDIPKIISQDYQEIDVPAGHFKTVHIVASTKDVPKMEEWANPQATCMDGSVKVIETTSQATITMELTSFKKMP